MKEKIKNLSNKKIVITSLCAFAIILLLGFTYAYWTRTFNQTGENISTYDCFDIAFSENTERITMENGYPISDEEGLKTDAYEVTITNTCKTVASYNVILNKLNTSTLDDSHIKIAVNSNIKYLSKTQSVTSSLSNVSEARIINSGALAGGQERTIKVQNWMDENTSEEDGANKTFSYKITIEAIAGKINKLLSAKILEENLQSLNPKFENSYPSTVGYKEVVEENHNYTNEIYTGSDHGLRAIGTGYTFDVTTGKYTVTGATLDEYSKDYINYYTCENALVINNSCSEMIKIKEINDTATDGKVYITKADVYTSATDESLLSGGGLYKSVDESGDTYYYRGDVKNNYVSFANNIWRVVRINGDGSIRLILRGPIGEKQWNDLETTFDNQDGIGWTSNNDHICTISNPCISTSGTSSMIKSYVEDWYNNNLNLFDEQIALGNYCNDTSIVDNDDDNYIDYGAYNRLYNINTRSKPTLICSDTKETYGGAYKLKIGLLSADEIVMAGYGPGQSSASTSDNYLYKQNYWWSMTPFRYYSRRDNHYNIVYSPYKGYLGNSNTLEDRVFPVVNLNADVLITSGDGTENNPYVIE